MDYRSLRSKLGAAGWGERSGDGGTPWHELWEFAQQNQSGRQRSTAGVNVGGSLRLHERLARAFR